MNNKRWRFYDIIYKNNIQGPNNVIVNLENYEWCKDIPVGFGNLNCKAYKVIKEITGLEINSCKVEMIYLDKI